MISTLDLDREVRKIAETIAQSAGFSQFPLVLQSFLSFYNVHSLECLGISNLPTLDLIYVLDKKTTTFLEAYLGLHEIITLKDIETDLLHLLNSFRIPSLKKQHSLLRKDGNELDIDDDDDNNENNSIARFADFGIGELHCHPILKPLFPRFPTSSLLVRSEVYVHLLSWLEDSQQLSQSPENLIIEKFQQHLTSLLDVSACNEAGVVFIGPLHHDMLLLQHIRRRRFESEIELKKRFLEGVSETQTHKKRPLNKEAVKVSSMEYSYGCNYDVNHHINCNIRNDMMFSSSSTNRSGLADLLKISDQKPSDDNSKDGTQVAVEIFHFNTSTSSFVEKKMHMTRTEAVHSIDMNRVYSFCLPWKSPPVDTDDHRVIGRWGEALVYQFLLFTRSNDAIVWLNLESECNAAYDLTITHRCEGSAQRLQATRFIEVKTTRFTDKNVFQISPWEYDFMYTHPRPSYDIYRVYGAPDNPRLVIYEDVYTLIQQKQVGLCLAVQPI